MNRWGREGPPPEAYSRVSNPERFRPLHDVALALLQQLDAAFTVSHSEGYGLDSDLKVGGLARPSIRLVPADLKSAPLAVTFTTFPGLRVRAGRWCTAVFPECGCDACDESAEDEAARLTRLIDDVVAGRFRERIVLPPQGDGSQEWELWSSPLCRYAGRLLIDREEACAKLADVAGASIDWLPWTRRQVG